MDVQETISCQRTFPSGPRSIDDLFESEILPAGRPAVFKGAVNHWPLVQRRTDSAAAIIGIPENFQPGYPGGVAGGRAEINGRFFYNDAMNGMNFRRVRGTLADALTLLVRHIADPAPPALALQALPIVGPSAAF